MIYSASSAPLFPSLSFSHTHSHKLTPARFVSLPRYIELQITRYFRQLNPHPLSPPSPPLLLLLETTRLLSATQVLPLYINIPFSHLYSALTFFFSAVLISAGCTLLALVLVLCLSWYIRRRRLSRKWKGEVDASGSLELQQEGERSALRSSTRLELA